jgi:putative phage-type endonuclease
MNELSTTDLQMFSATYLGTFTSDSPEWHELRSHGIGGSEMGTIIGLNPWESAYALWAKKTGKITDDFKENWAVRLGKAFEEPIVKLFEEEHPELEIFSCGTFASNEVDFLHANPDALARHRETGEWFVIEIKTARYTWDGVPPHYVCQVQHYMDVLGIPKSYVVAVAGMDYKEYFIEADSFQQSVQRDAAFRFWDKLQKDERPDWDGSESTYQAVRRVNPEIENTDVELGELGIGLWNAQRRADEAQAELNQYKSATLEAMGKAKTAYVTVDDLPPVKVASRQMRGGSPALIIHKKGN